MNQSLVDIQDRILQLKAENPDRPLAFDLVFQSSDTAQKEWEAEMRDIRRRLALAEQESAFIILNS